MLIPRLIRLSVAASAICAAGLGWWPDPSEKPVTRALDDAPEAIPANGGAGTSPNAAMSPKHAGSSHPFKKKIIQGAGGFERTVTFAGIIPPSKSHELKPEPPDQGKVPERANQAMLDRLKAPLRSSNQHHSKYQSLIAKMRAAEARYGALPSYSELERAGALLPLKHDEGVESAPESTSAYNEKSAKPAKSSATAIRGDRESLLDQTFGWSSALCDDPGVKEAKGKIPEAGYKIQSFEGSNPLLETEKIVNATQANLAGKCTHYSMKVREVLPENYPIESTNPKITVFSVYYNLETGEYAQSASRSFYLGAPEDFQLGSAPRTGTLP